MKTKFYFWLAYRFLHLGYFFDKLRIRCDYYFKICRSRAIVASKMSALEKASMLNGFIDFK